MAPHSAPPVSLAHSAAGLRLTAHPGNRRPREHPPPPASLRGWARPLICIEGGAPPCQTPPRFRAVPDFKNKGREAAICIKGRGLRTPGRRLAREAPWRRRLRRVARAERRAVGAQNLHDGGWERGAAHAWCARGRVSGRETRGNGARPSTLSAEGTGRTATSGRDDVVEGGVYMDPGRAPGPASIRERHACHSMCMEVKGQLAGVGSNQFPSYSTSWEGSSHANQFPSSW
ncbi:natural cytotoxicity triggering receptor 3 isoform X1 [Peromyscus leucopus]|uniref:natural cytotoxicity triggering receptor 3 isoform X1 n=1 Tax=Peromyscus leucopus TaxID=10041 RepID=UPI00188499FF|nr:natural cytotoxicity triggering receptor 3 isoform X1 [Peromyscus leucopus]